MVSTNRNKLIACAVVGLLMVLFPVYASSPYYLYVVTLLYINVILAVSLALLGRTGQWSFAHAAFMGIGAYSSALLTTQAGVSFWLALPIAGVMAGIVSIAIGYPAIRLKGTQFILASFAFGAIVMQIFPNIRTDILGGFSGMIGVPRPSIGRFEFNSPASYYYLLLVAMLFTVFVMHRIHRSRFGMVLRAIGEKDSLAESVGINIARYRVLAFAIGCFFAGMAGSLFAHFNRSVLPTDYLYMVSFYVLVYVVVGGLGTPIAGPIIGAALLFSLVQFLGKLGPYEVLGYGLVLLVVMRFMPRGITGLRISRPRFLKEKQGAKVHAAT